MENLCFLSEQAQGLRTFLLRKLAPLIALPLDLERGWDLGGLVGLDPIEIEFVIKEWLCREEITPSREILKRLVAGVQNRESNKRFLLKGVELFLDVNRLKVFRK